MNISEAKKVFSEEVYIGDLSIELRQYIGRLMKAGRLLSREVKATAKSVASNGDSEWFMEKWNSLSGTKKCLKMNEGRKAALAVRLKDPGWKDGFIDACQKFPLKCFEQNAWMPHVDWILKPDTVCSILEGKYDWVRDSEFKKKEVRNDEYDHIRNRHEAPTEKEFRKAIRKPTN